jgi:hypothetical protein
MKLIDQIRLINFNKMILIFLKKKQIQYWIPNNNFLFNPLYDRNIMYMVVI